MDSDRPIDASRSSTRLQTVEEAESLQAQYVADRKAWYATTGLPLSHARGYGSREV